MHKLTFLTLFDATFSHARSPASTRREARTHDGGRGKERNARRGDRNEYRPRERDVARERETASRGVCVSVSEETLLRQKFRSWSTPRSFEIVDEPTSR
jgi:hypothetical protein